MPMDAKKKAELIEEGGVEVDGPILSHLSRSTAGPGAGLESFFLIQVGTVSGWASVSLPGSRLALMGKKLSS